MLNADDAMVKIHRHLGDEPHAFILCGHKCRWLGRKIAFRCLLPRSGVALQVFN